MEENYLTQQKAKIREMLAEYGIREKFINEILADEKAVKELIEPNVQKIEKYLDSVVERHWNTLSH